MLTTAVAEPFVPPLQLILVGVAVTFTAGFTIAVAVEVDVFPPVSVIVTVYVVVDAGQEFMFCVVTPLLHEYVYGLMPPVPLDVIVAQAPGHIELPVVVTVGLLQSITVIELDAVALHPALVTVWIML